MQNCPNQYEQSSVATQRETETPAPGTRQALQSLVSALINMKVAELEQRSCEALIALLLQQQTDCELTDKLWKQVAFLKGCQQPFIHMY